MFFFRSVAVLSKLGSRIAQQSTSLGSARWFQTQSALGLDLRSQLKDLIPEQQDLRSQLKDLIPEQQVKNPWPNVAAHSGVSLSRFGLSEARDHNIDFLHIFMKRNQTFVTVTDAKGNKKTGASAGCLDGRQGRSRYAAEATAEHVGRSARKMGLKSVVIKVKGYTYFKKKSKVILSWREGFQGSGGGDKTTFMSIHDVTQLPHNGCRLPKKRRV